MSKQKIREWIKSNNQKLSDIGFLYNSDEQISDLIDQYTKDQSADMDIELEDIIRVRDYWEEKATELANDISDYHGFEVGEHSNINNPVQNAIDTLHCIKNKIGDHTGTKDQNAWVSVNDRLPDEIIHLVLVCRNIGIPATMPARFINGKFMVADGFCNNQEFVSPTHWQPLPLPPTQEG